MTHTPAALQKLLLVGTARAAVGLDALAPELAAIVGPASNAASGAGATPERQLWLALGAQRLWMRAGHVPPAAPVAGVASSLPEHLPPCPGAAEALLAGLLGAAGAPPASAILNDLLGESVSPPLLLEWLRLLNSRQARLPERFLPNLLERASRAPALRPAVRTALGMRGRWLSQFDPAWSWADADFALDTALVQDAWHNGAAKERVAALEAWRRIDPAGARDALQACWTAEPPESRSAFLPCLAINLDAADEPFLEAALDDRRKAVRTSARELLARLPGSALSQRMLARLAPLLQLEKSASGDTRLVLVLPESCDVAMTRDGVGEQKHAGLGEKAGWLVDMLATVDPSTWSTRFGLSPDACFALAAATDYREVLMRGWIAGLELHLVRAATPGLLAWLAAWTRSWLGAGGRRFYSGAPPFVVAYLSLPAPVLHAALHDLVRASGATWTDKDIPLVELLQHLAAEPGMQWPAPLSRELMRRLLGGLPALAPHQWALRWAVKVLAAVLDPAAVLEATADWSGLAADTNIWQEVLDPFFHVVRFRHEMILSFQEHA